MIQELGIETDGYGTISPDIWRRILLDYDSLGAAYKYADAVVPLLIENGAKIEIWNQKNRQGWTPLRIAAGIHRTMNLRKSPEVAAELRKAMMAAGVSTHIDPETNISGGTR